MLVCIRDNVVFKQNLVRKAIDKSRPAGLNDVARNTDHVPVAVFIAKRCPYANRRIGCHVGTEHTHLEVVEAYAFHAREERQKRLAESLSRTRKRIFEIAACNPWEWFFTGTLNGEKWDRNDINGVFRALSQWFRDYRKKAGCGDLKYLIVPEQHKKGGWHFHGLFHGLPETELLNFSAGEKIPLRLKRVIQGGTDIFNWSPYSEKFGYTTLTKIKDRHAVACYVTKYITKDMVAENAALGTGRHLYYASQGLKKPAVVAEGYSDASHIFSGYDYENEYVQIRKIDTFEDAVQFVERYRLSRGGEGLETCGNSDS